MQAILAMDRICYVSATRGTPPAEPATGLHARVLDLIGTAVCSGEMSSGDVLYIDDLAD